MTIQVHADETYDCERLLSLRGRTLTLSPVFFFGTLMVPQILTRVLGHKGQGLMFQDAILPVRCAHFFFVRD